MPNTNGAVGKESILQDITDLTSASLIFGYFDIAEMFVSSHNLDLDKWDNSVRIFGCCSDYYSCCNCWRCCNCCFGNFYTLMHWRSQLGIRSLHLDKHLWFLFLLTIVILMSYFLFTNYMHWQFVNECFILIFYS